MRIAQLLPTNCDVRPSGSRCAAGNAVRDLGEALVSRGHEVTLYGPATAVTTMALPSNNGWPTPGITQSLSRSARCARYAF
jgi:hypothetical protein